MSINESINIKNNNRYYCLVEYTINKIVKYQSYRPKKLVFVYRSFLHNVFNKCIKNILVHIISKLR